MDAQEANASDRPGTDFQIWDYDFLKDQRFRYSTFLLRKLMLLWEQQQKHSSFWSLVLPDSYVFDTLQLNKHRPAELWARLTHTSLYRHLIIGIQIMEYLLKYTRTAIFLMIWVSPKSASTTTHTHQLLLLWFAASLTHQLLLHIASMLLRRSPHDSEVASWATCGGGRSIASSHLFLFIQISLPTQLHSLPDHD